MFNATGHASPREDQFPRQDGINRGGFTGMFTGSQRLARETAAVVLAGGKGTRLGALTLHECKPALPFGGAYRNIDFSLSNCANSGISRIGVATQYKDASLLRHLARVWSDPDQPNTVMVKPWRAELQTGSGSYLGTADAVYQNWAEIEALDARLVLILAGDHVYKMDYRPMLQAHVACQADITVGCVEVPTRQASDFGVMSIDQASRIIRFAEKPRHPESLPGQPGWSLGSMGIYVFNRDFLGRMLKEDALAETSSHDFGRDLLPRLINQAKVFAYPFNEKVAVGGGYWRDVGTIGGYWRAHMELLDGVPGFDLDDTDWPVRSNERPVRVSPLITRFATLQHSGVYSILAGGCVTDRAFVHHSVLSSNVTVAEYSEVFNAVILPGARIGRHCLVRNAVVASGVRIPDGAVINPPRHGKGTDAPTLITTETCAAGNRTAQGWYRRHNHVEATISERR